MNINEQTCTQQRDTLTLCSPGAHTNGFSICACSLCVLEIGGISECYTGRFITERAFMMIDGKKAELIT